MALWQESESIHFDIILSEIFDNWLDFELAVEEWTEEQWREAVEEKIETENFSEEIKKFVKSEFQRFLVWCQNADTIWQESPQAKCEENTVESLEEFLESCKVEEERKKEQLVKKRAEIREREQRKAKQLPLVLTLIEMYQLAQKRLEEEKTAENYQEVLDICYYIMCDYGFLGCLDEFSGVPQYYKDMVIEYFNKTKKVDGFSYIIQYYTSKELLREIHDLKLKQERVMEGIKYIELFYQLFSENEKYADRYIECYMCLSWWSSNEGLERLKYALKAYKLAKKFALEFKSEKMLNTLEEAMGLLQLYYLEHQQETDLESLELDYQEVKKQICI